MGATTRLRESLTLRQDLDNRRGIAECLEGLAAVAAGQGQSERAARLLGGADALRRASGAALAPVERLGYEATVQTARAALGEAAFAAAWATGQRLTVEEAVAAALAEAPAE